MVCIPLTPAHEKQKQEDFCELEPNLVYNASSRPTRAIQRNRISKNKQITPQNKPQV